MATLDSWLNAAYGASIHRKGLVDSVIQQDFKKSIEQDSELAAEAKKRLLELVALNKSRGEPCAFSKVHREFLQGVLNG